MVCNQFKSQHRSIFAEHAGGVTNYHVICLSSVARSKSRTAPCLVRIRCYWRLEDRTHPCHKTRDELAVSRYAALPMLVAALRSRCHFLDVPRLIVPNSPLRKGVWFELPNFLFRSLSSISLWAAMNAGVLICLYHIMVLD